MVPAWVSEWVGIPHAKLGRGPDTYDCLGLIIALSKARRGVVIPDPYCTIGQAVRRMVASGNRDLYDEVDDPQEGDIILIRQKGFPIHVGYCINGSLMLHTLPETGSVVEKWNGMRWGNRVLGVYRYNAEHDAGRGR